MLFKLNDKEHKLNFGVKFVNDVDKTFTIPGLEAEVGVGLIATIELLEMFDTNALVTVIQKSIVGTRATEKQILESLDEIEDIEEFYVELLDELKKSKPVTMRLERTKEFRQKVDELAKKKANA